MLDVAREFQVYYKPEVDDMDIMFVHGTRVLGTYLTVKEAKLENRATITAVITQRWQVTLRTYAYDDPRQHGCSCGGLGDGGYSYRECTVWGPNFIINFDTLKPAFKPGKKTAFADIVSCLSRDDLAQLIDNRTSILVDFCSQESLWSCAGCHRCAFSREWCTPRDADGSVWCFSSSRLVYCGACRKTHLPGLPRLR